MAIAATIGMFDGFHLGHRTLVESLKSEAGKRGLATAVVTFRDHPQNVLHNAGQKWICTLDDRIRCIADQGVDYLILMDFTPELAALDSTAFMALLRDCYGLKALVVGFNHRFGHNRNEQFADYRRHGSELGVDVARAEEYVAQFAPISSSIIRRLLNEGDVTTAANKLGRSFTLKGTVCHGFARGRDIGFPTANVALPQSDLIVPRNGVYAVQVTLPDGSQRGGMANIGIRPTFADSTERSIEIHIFDFKGDLYGKSITVEFVCRLRDERAMSSIDELKRQLTADLSAAHDALAAQR